MSISQIDVSVDNSNLIPIRAHNTDAGLDFKAKEYTLLPKGVRVLVRTGVKVRIPPGYVGMLVPRSSLSKKYIIMTNSIGIIDSDYRGEILASLMYVGTENMMDIEAGDKIVQLLLVPIALPVANVVYEDDEEWNDTARGTGGFGSTGQ